MKPTGEDAGRWLRHAMEQDLPRLALADAVLCLDCDTIYHRAARQCPTCASASGMPVPRIANVIDA